MCVFLEYPVYCACIGVYRGVLQGIEVKRYRVCKVFLEYLVYCACIGVYRGVLQGIDV